MQVICLNDLKCSKKTNKNVKNKYRQHRQHVSIYCLIWSLTKYCYKKKPIGHVKWKETFKESVCMDFECSNFVLKYLNEKSNLWDYNYVTSYFIHEWYRMQKQMYSQQWITKNFSLKVCVCACVCVIVIFEWLVVLEIF